MSRAAAVWQAEGASLWCVVSVHESQRNVFDDYVHHRLRCLRARTTGLLHAEQVQWADGRLTLRFASEQVLSVARGCGTPELLPAGRWRTDVVLPAMHALVDCHESDVSGFAPFLPVGGRWVPPVSWFVPGGADDADARRAEDFRHAERWMRAEIERLGRAMDPTDRRAVELIVAALRGGDGPGVARLVRGEIEESRRARRREPSAPKFLSVLTEAELLERLSGVYRFHLLPPHEVERLGINLGRQRVIALDTNWKDPHFPTLKRSTPQELWDELVEESRTTPVLAVSRSLPNPLEPRLGDAAEARWIGVHPDQPLAYVIPDGDLPATGFVRLHQAGDNALMVRKRAFTRFAGHHPALAPRLDHAPAKLPFADNLQPRSALEDAILGTHGVFAVQGPPGTGKTYLATQVVRRFLKRTPAARVLVCAKEHFALDNILRTILKCLESDGTPFRAFRSLSLAKRRRGGNEVDAKWQATAVTRDLAERAWSDAAAGWSFYQTSTRDQHDQRLRTLAAQSANLFFCTTMDAAMVDFLDRESFDLVIVEEAGKCYPSELLHALCLGRTILMIGDQRQLPPFQERRTHEGLAAWLATLDHARADGDYRSQMEERFGEVFLSLEAFVREGGTITDESKQWLRPFEYLFDRSPSRHRLEEQFRMEAPLSRVVGTVFYGRPFEHRKPELVAAGLLPADPLAGVLPEALDMPLLWIDTPHVTDDAAAGEDRDQRKNPYEHDVVLRYLRRLLPARKIDMVILTPYNAQKRLLLESGPLREVCAALTATPFEQVVRTTDEYQGREAELTVLSLVRNNTLGARAWGFMTEPERLNVMFSRTRFRQVVVACSAHIERHAEEARWLHDVWKEYRREAADSKCARIIKPSELDGDG